ncbi:substrate-binding domain-containing protein [Burkholderia plantarii]|uniref:substrate-binding domain-containing protein n=1 Tax=Burkholderia plantarii TaxID=41899 RepID=UPI0008708FDB|nr:substrate-binding domain-containing protein [Burkholderia plantarii]
MTSHEGGAPPLTLISSMATRQILQRLADQHAALTGQRVAVESVGGVEAARRVAQGEPFDLVALAGDALASLEQAGRVDAASRVAVARSGIAVAVREGATRPAIDTEQAVRQAVADSRSIGYSTGPSGRHLEALFARWGLADAIAARLVQARPGVPVASLVASGEVELGFQQGSELLGQPGIVVLGPLPDAVQAVTVFGAALGTAAAPARVDAARRFLAFLASPQAEAAKRAFGMEPA